MVGIRLAIQALAVIAVAVALAVPLWLGLRAGAARGEVVCYLAGLLNGVLVVPLVVLAAGSHKFASPSQPAAVLI